MIGDYREAAAARASVIRKNSTQEEPVTQQPEQRQQRFQSTVPQQQQQQQQQQQLQQQQQQQQQQVQQSEKGVSQERRDPSSGEPRRGRGRPRKEEANGIQGQSPVSGVVVAKNTPITVTFHCSHRYYILLFPALLHFNTVTLLHAVLYSHASSCISSSDVQNAHFVDACCFDPIN